MQAYLIDVLEERCSEALSVIERLNRSEVIVAFSGGKDSVVLLDLASKVLGRFKVVYASIPANTHPLCDEYVYDVVQRYDCELFVARRHDCDFWSFFQRYGYPCRNRWCLGQFKDVPIAAITRGRGVGLIGVRRYESLLRRRRYDSFFSPRKTNSYKWVQKTVAPLLNWTSVDIDAYIKREKIPVNPLYEKVGWSCNCVFCPFLSSERMRVFLTSSLLAPFRELWLRNHKNLKQKGCEVLWKKWNAVSEGY